MKNSKCIICGTEFPARQGKLYCSDKCRQAHRRLKEDPNYDLQSSISNFISPEDLKDMDIEFLKKIKLLERKPIFRININEFQAFCNKFSISEDLIHYAFFRKNLTGIPSLDEIKNFYELYGKEAYPGNWNDDGTMDKEYNAFCGMIFCGLVEFYYSDEYKDDIN